MVRPLHSGSYIPDLFGGAVLGVHGKYMGGKMDNQRLLKTPGLLTEHVSIPPRCIYPNPLKPKP